MSLIFVSVGSIGSFYLYFLCSQEVIVSHNKKQKDERFLIFLYCLKKRGIFIPPQTKHFPLNI